MSGVRLAIAQPGFDVGDAFAGFDGGGTGHGADNGLAAGPFARGRLGGHGQDSGLFVVILVQTGVDRVVIPGGKQGGLGYGDIGRRFKNDTERLEKLFELYTKMTASTALTKGKKRRAGVKA
ncbi:hypothetical protein RM530_17915 [Algiphilus sp. W345]|uniref:Uncharacterized protein n=1 Tax=Banduia mediterranea TaxID=3075609 RepID=A0ABU2WPS1_9GAMM|nr:hypothetical protein [Algiphilus sp. W345]MDT0499224.1 hypothetical protein [Algiphilus sp. W345]